jgi:hypothetical protein
MAETKTATVQLRMRPSLKGAAERAAAADQRSLTGFIEKLLIDHLREERFLGSDSSPQTQKRKGVKSGGDT